MGRLIYGYVKGAVFFAKFDLDANSINFDAPEATISDADTVVNANNFTVTLPDAFTCQN